MPSLSIAQDQQGSQNGVDMAGSQLVVSFIPQRYSARSMFPLCTGVSKRLREVYVT